jgi:hypothetical protein
VLFFYLTRGLDQVRLDMRDRLLDAWGSLISISAWICVDLRGLA